MENLELSSHTKNPNSLYSYLDKALPIIVPDRSLSTFGIKNLKELRSLASNWPLAGVYTFSDIAQNILKKNNLFREPLNDLEAFAYLAELDPAKELKNLKRYFDLSKQLRKLGGLSDLQKVILDKDLQKSLNENIFYSLLTLFQVTDYAKNKNQSAHFFDYIEDATRFLQENPNLTLDFHKFRADAENKIFILGFRDLYSAEESFLKELEKRYEIIFQYTQEEPQTEATFSIQSSSLHENDHVLWISSLEAPGPLEAKVLTEYPKALKVRIDPELRYVNKEVQNLIVNFDKEKFLKNEEKTNNTELKKLIKRIAEKGAPEEIKVLDSLNFFRDSRMERSLNGEVFQNSPILFTIEDFPIMNPLQTLIWGEQKTWGEFYFNLASESSHLKVPEDIEKALLAEGVSLPNHFNEQDKLKSLISTYSPHFKFLKTTQKKEFEVKKEVFEVKANRQPILSPSSLENLARCPLNFYYSRECKIPLYEIPNDIEGSPIKRGQWIHGVLEKIDFRNLKNFRSTDIEKLLHSELGKAFEGFASQSYLKILQSQIPQLSESLFFYIDILEKPLQKLFPFRKIETEKNISCTWTSELKLRGRVDRLDFIGEGALLWDYKTSNYSGTKFSSLLESGRFQWLLYKEIFDKEGVPIYGGGYLNPVDLKKSRLIFFENAPIPASFFDFLSDQSIRFEQVKKADAVQMSQRLHEIIEEQTKIWLSPTRKAAPLNSKVCSECNHQAFCAYPYGVLPC